jgi:hypothetical protein
MTREIGIQQHFCRLPWKRGFLKMLKGATWHPPDYKSTRSDCKESKIKMLL